MDLNTGDFLGDFLEAKALMEDVVQRRRRVFGPAHPSTVDAEHSLTLTIQFLRQFDVGS